MRYRRAPTSDRSLTSDHVEPVVLPRPQTVGTSPGSLSWLYGSPAIPVLAPHGPGPSGVAGNPVHQISLVPRSKLVFSYFRALPVILTRNPNLPRSLSTTKRSGKSRRFLTLATLAAAKHSSISFAGSGTTILRGSLPQTSSTPPTSFAVSTNGTRLDLDPLSRSDVGSTPVSDLASRPPGPVLSSAEHLGPPAPLGLASCLVPTSRFSSRVALCLASSPAGPDVRFAFGSCPRVRILVLVFVSVLVPGRFPTGSGDSQELAP
jgi:hypothetical protein